MGDRLERIEELFHGALERDAPEREGWLRERCGGDGELEREVLELIAEHEEDDEDLDTSASALRAMAEELGEVRLEAGRRIGPFVLGRVMASGGMGTVYEAQQEQPRRRVALKVLRLGLADALAERRFEYESRILAHLRHPGIAHVYGCGTLSVDGRRVPWFAMELIEKAHPLSIFADEQGLDIERRLKLFLEVCDAVHHGHLKGIIHRDLKPANILVGAGGRIKIIDFGVAKATDVDLGMVTLQTLQGQLVGTLGYMSPEQAAAEGVDIDVRSDVYSLGVVLFELLTGEPPYHLEGHSIMAAVRILSEAEPNQTPMDAVALPEDLRTILGKALAKDREQRYDSARALADDLQRFLHCEPIAARAPSALYELRRFVRRNRLVVGALAGLILVLTLGVIGTLLGYLRAEDERAQAEHAQTQAEWGLDFLARILYDADPWQGPGPQATLGQALAVATSRLEEDLPDEPVEARIRAILGQVLVRTGYHAQAEQNLRRAIALERELNGPNTDEILRLQCGLILVLTHERRLEEAEGLATALVERCRRVRGADDQMTLRARNFLAQILLARERTEEALVAHRENLAAYLRLGASASAEAMTCRNNLATTLHKMGRYDEAEKLFREVVAWRGANLRADHPDILTAQSNLAATLTCENRYEEAIALLRPTLAGQEASLGEHNLKTLSSICNLGVLLRKAGHLDEAEVFTRRGLEGRRQIFGPRSAQANQARCNLGVLLVAQAEARGEDLTTSTRAEEAAGLYRECRQVLEAMEDAPREQLFQVLANSAYLHLRRGRYEQAYREYQRANSLADELWDDQRRERDSLRAGLGAAATGMGRYDEAEKLLVRAYERLRPKLGKDHPAIRFIRSSLAELARASGRKGLLRLLEDRGP